MIRKIFIFLVLIFLSGFFSWTASSASKPEMYYFWGDTCPYCAEAKPFIDQLEKDYPEINIVRYEIYSNKDNYQLFVTFSDAYDVPIEERGVPAFFIGDDGFSGYDVSLEENFRRIIENCISSNCGSPMSRLKEIQQVNEQSEAVPIIKERTTSKTSSVLLFLIIIFIFFLIYSLFPKNKNRVEDK